MKHWYGNQMCVVDVETTGLDPLFHEIIQLAVVPIDSNFEPCADKKPFTILIKPKNIEGIDRKAMKVHGFTVKELLEQGFDSEAAIEFFLKWVDELDLPYLMNGERYRIMPLGQNYSFDRSFIMDWLGADLYNDIFHYHFRDTMITAHYLNDRSAMHAEDIPYKKANLAYLATQHEIPHERSHDAFADCLVTAALYKAMTEIGIF